MIRRDPAAELARAIAFQNAIAVRCADEIEPFAWGRALFAAAVPDMWDRNFLVVDGSGHELSVPGLVQEAERLMAPRSYKHRKVVVHDQELGDELAPGFSDLRWEVTELVWMIHRRPPDRTSYVPVDELAEATYVRVKEEFDRRNPDVADSDVLRQMSAASRLVGRATDRRCFGAYVDDTVAAVCELYSDGLTAQIEDVGTLEEFRGRGLATAVVLRALHEAEAWGHDFVFLCADNDDWPKELYTKLGFDAVGRTYQFLLKDVDRREGNRYLNVPS